MMHTPSDLATCTLMAINILPSSLLRRELDRVLNSLLALSPPTLDRSITAYDLPARTFLTQIQATRVRICSFLLSLSLLLILLFVHLNCSVSNTASFPFLSARCSSIWQHPSPQASPPLPTIKSQLISSN